MERSIELGPQAQHFDTADDVGRESSGKIQSMTAAMQTAAYARMGSVRQAADERREVWNARAAQDGRGQLDTDRDSSTELEERDDLDTRDEQQPNQDPPTNDLEQTDTQDRDQEPDQDQQQRPTLRVVPDPDDQLQAERDTAEADAAVEGHMQRTGAAADDDPDTIAHLGATTGRGAKVMTGKRGSLARDGFGDSNEAVGTEAHADDPLREDYLSEGYHDHLDPSRGPGPELPGRGPTRGA